jgi:type II secretory pathway pseudopilin PulG
VTTQQHPTRWRPWRSDRRGFTTIELVFVVLIAGTIMGLAMPAFREYQNRRIVMNARHAYMMSAAPARAAASERGEVIVLMTRIFRDSVFVMNGAGTDTLEMIDFRGGETRADILLDGTPAPFRICYMPRGFVHPSCQDGQYLPAKIGFTTWAGADTAWAIINAVGQVQPQ